MTERFGDLLKLAGLRDRDLRREGLFVAEGRLLVERAFASSLSVVGVCASSACADEAFALAASRAPVAVYSPQELDAVAGFPFHRGLFAVVERPRTQPLAEYGTTPIPTAKILVLPAITDPGNLGSLLRSALAFGYGAAFLGRESCDPFNRKALRASMGASLCLPLRDADASDLASLRASGFLVLAAAMEECAIALGGGSPEEIALFRALKGEGCAHALVLGNEYGGIASEWRDQCARAVMLPVSESVDSLNVAIAGSILMWELSRRSLPVSWS